LSDRQKLEASECYRLLDGQNASLLEALHHYLAYLDQTKRSIGAGEKVVALGAHLLHEGQPKEVPDQFYQARKKLGDEARKLPQGAIGPFVNAISQSFRLACEPFLAMSANRL
jgi:hypothetical protein